MNTFRRSLSKTARHSGVPRSARSASRTKGRHIPVPARRPPSTATWSTRSAPTATSFAWMPPRGKRCWRKNLLTDFGGKSGTWAYAESPLVDGDVLVVTPGGKEATMVALNKKNGEVIWKSPLSCRMAKRPATRRRSSSTPPDSSSTCSFAARVWWASTPKPARPSGATITRPTGAAATIASPVAADGYIYTGTHYTGGGTVKLSRDGDGVKAEEVYYEKKGLPTAIGGAVVLGDYLYGTNNELTLCINFKTGEVKWQRAAIHFPCVHTLCRRSALLAGQEKGDVALVEATPEGFKPSAATSRRPASPKTASAKPGSIPSSPTASSTSTIGARSGATTSKRLPANELLRDRASTTAEPKLNFACRTAGSAASFC